MVKVFRPAGVFERCVNTAIVGALATHMDERGGGRGDAPRGATAHEVTTSDEEDSDSDGEAVNLVELEPRVVDQSVQAFKLGLLRRIDDVEMDILRRRMQFQDGAERAETMRLYNRSVEAARMNRPFA